MEYKARPYSTWVNKRHYQIHRSLRTLPLLEEELAGVCEELARAHLSSQDAKVEQMLLLTCLAGLRAEIQTAYKALSDLRQGVERSKLTDEDFENGISKIFAQRPSSERILAGVKNAGGMRAFLKRISTFLSQRYSAFTECLKLVKGFDPNTTNGFGRMVANLWERLPGGPGTPSQQYKFLCLAGPWGLLATIVVVGAVLIISEDEVDEDPPPDSDGGGDDPGENVCYPENWDIEGQVCHPE